jgi:hypothetical protein
MPLFTHHAQSLARPPAGRDRCSSWLLETAQGEATLTGSCGGAGLSLPPTHLQSLALKAGLPHSCLSPSGLTASSLSYSLAPNSPGIWSYFHGRLMYFLQPALPSPSGSRLGSVAKLHPLHLEDQSLVTSQEGWWGKGTLRSPMPASGLPAQSLLCHGVVRIS